MVKFAYWSVSIVFNDFYHLGTVVSATAVVCRINFKKNLLSKKTVVFGYGKKLQLTLSKDVQKIIRSWWRIYTSLPLQTQEIFQRVYLHFSHILTLEDIYYINANNIVWDWASYWLGTWMKVPITNIDNSSFLSL